MSIGNEAARVLVADDDDLFRMTVSMMLEEMDCEVLEAANGADALTHFQDEAIDLVITDIIMPDMEGIETIMLMRKKRPSLPIIAMSGGGQTGSMDFLEIAQKLGATAAIQKPFEYEDFSKLVSQFFPARTCERL